MSVLIGLGGLLAGCQQNNSASKEGSGESVPVFTQGEALLKDLEDPADEENPSTTIELYRGIFPDLERTAAMPLPGYVPTTPDVPVTEIEGYGYNSPLKLGLYAAFQEDLYAWKGSEIRKLLTSSSEQVNIRVYWQNDTLYLQSLSDADGRILKKVTFNP